MNVTFEKYSVLPNDSWALATGLAVSALLFFRERRVGLSIGLVEDVCDGAGPRDAGRSGGALLIHGRHGARSLEARQSRRAKPITRILVRLFGNPHWRMGFFIGHPDPGCESSRAASHRAGTFAASPLANCVCAAVATAAARDRS